MIRARWAVFFAAILIAETSLGRAAEPFRFPEAKHKGGELKYINGLPVLTVAGTPEEIGEQVATLTAGSVKPPGRIPYRTPRPSSRATAS